MTSVNPATTADPDPNKFQLSVFIEPNLDGPLPI